MKSYTQLDDEERAVIGKLLCRLYGIRKIVVRHVFIVSRSQFAAVVNLV